MRLSPLPADQWDDAARHAVSVMLPEERRNPDDAGNSAVHPGPSSRS